VLAEPRELKLPDAGFIDRAVGSHDALDVMLRSASDEAPRWLSMLRETSELRVVLVTDDGSDRPDAKVWLERFRRVVGGSRALSLNVIGGFAVDSRQPLLFAGDPVSTRSCRPDVDARGRRVQPWGIDPGSVYQELAIATGGARASLCSETSRLSLIEPLLADARRTAGCAWSLGAGARIVDVRASGKRGSDYLLREYSTAQCAGMKRGYVVDGPMLVLCAETCARMRDEGFEQIEARVECER